MSGLDVLKQAALDEVYEQDGPVDPDGELVAEIVDSWVPAMTSELFALVVECNGLGFREVERGVAGDTPFSVLALAVRDEIGEYVRESLEADAEREGNCE